MIDYSSIFLETKLPKPLKKEELIHNIKQAQQGSLESRNIVITHNIKLVLNQVIKKFNNTPYESKELVSIGIMGLIKAVDNFNLEKNVSFSAFAITCINNEILMYIRYNKKHLNDTSFNSPIGTDKDGSELMLEDILEDDNNDYEIIENKESIIEIRNQVQSLKIRDKKIISLYYGFNNKRHTQEEIAKLLGFSRTYISRLIVKIEKQIKENLIQKGFADDSGTNNKLRKERKIMPRNLKTIFECLNCSKEQFETIQTKLSEEENNLIKLRYGEDLDNPKPSPNWTKENNSKFYYSLVPKMKKMLANPDKIIKDRKPRNKKAEKEVLKDNIDSVKGTSKILENATLIPNNESQNIILKEDNIKTLEALKSPIFKKLMKFLSIKEMIVISLKFGYANGKYYTTKEIANFLEMDETEVRTIIKKVLLDYKVNVIKFIDDVIKLTTEETTELSMKYSK
ncbi:MAG: sigma-70 family RNA polymerase sigma factor [Bacilli bacterium]|nr:sigma-70 family RNA polymerase sigma factor [Bacilli bacterium]